MQDFEQGKEPGLVTSAEEARPWPQRRQDAAAVLWPSFLAAALASLLCFAFVDPAALEFWPAQAEKTMARMSGYALGFFFFWGICALSSWVTLYLVRTAHSQ